MLQVVPTQIVSFIDEQYPFVTGQQQGSVSLAGLGNLSALLSLVDRLPDALITLRGDAYNDFIHCVESIRSIVTIWSSRGSTAPHENTRAATAVTRLRDCLSNLSDQQVPAGTAGLPFISDAVLRESIRQDIASTEQALRDAEWKGVTVIGGAVIEALLLWAINERRQPDVQTAVASLQASGQLRSG